MEDQAKTGVGVTGFFLFFLETVASLTIGKEGDYKSYLLIKAENMPPVKWICFTFTVFADRFKTSLVV